MGEFHDNIVLIGYMGTGKSTVSEYFGKMYSMDVAEVDQMIEEKAGKSIPDIFAQYGEEYFRDLETETLSGLQAGQNLIISCGGGVVLREENVAIMKKIGRVVLLTASPRTVWERVKDCGNRPLLKDKKDIASIAEMMEQRRKRYEAAADIVILTDDKTVPQVCGELVRKLTEPEHDS